MKVSWIAFLDPYAFGGGGELNQRAYIAAGRERGHEITAYSFLTHRAQRAARRFGVAPRFEPDLDADLVVLSNLRNRPGWQPRIPPTIIEQALQGGRVAVLQEAWVDVCRLDLPCHGTASACAQGCDRDFANQLYGSARAALFNSPMQRDAIASVLSVPLPPAILCRPAIDVERFRPLGLVRDIDVLYVGTISQPKGYGNLLERFGRGRVTFAGPNALGHPVDGNYLGIVAYDELPRLYNRARIFAHLPDWLEPMARTPVEAALCGCEVILNEHVGVASYPREYWTDPNEVRRGKYQMWLELETLFASPSALA